MIDATSDNMCLPALAAKSSPRLDKGKRVYGQNALAASDWPGRRSSLLQNQAYAQQFDSAAGSHTGSHDGPSSVRVYSHNDRDRLYDGLAGRPGLQGPPAPFNTPRRRFPAAGVSQVDGLLRNSKPLTSEHPSEYGELYTGAAGAPKHWLLASNSSASAPPRYRFQPVGAGPSQVDEVVLGHDIDCSTELTQLLLEGAAGIKSIGQTARVEARRHIPGGGDSQVDELIWGSDVDGSADPRIMEAKAQLFQGAAGGALQCKQPGRRNVPGGGDSQVDELIWGSDVDGSADPRIMEAKAQLFQGAAGTLPIRTEGRRQVEFNRHSGEEDSSRGKRHHPSPRDRVGPLLSGETAQGYTSHRSAYHVGSASQVDEVVLHRDIDGSNQQYLQYAELTAGAAGRRYVGSQDRAEGKRHIEVAESLVKEVFSPTAEHQVPRPGRRHIRVGAASRVDDVVLHHDIDGSEQQFLNYAELNAGAAGRRCVGADTRERLARRHIPAGTASQVDEVVLRHDIDSTKQQRFTEFAEVTAGAAGRRYVGRQDRVEGKRHIESASMMKELLSEGM